VKLTFTLHTMHVRAPFVSNKGTTTEVRQVMVRVAWHGLEGVGTALLAPNLGLVAETVVPALETAAALIADASPMHLEQLLNQLEVALPSQSSVRAAIDMALHDLVGQAAGLPLNYLWGLAGLPIGPTALSLSAGPEDALRAHVAPVAEWPILKLKLTADSDPLIVRHLRQIYNGRIWIDGNGSWDVDQAIAAIQIFHACGVELLEQPLPAGTPALLRVVRQHSPIPIVADEDCCTPDDLMRLHGCVDAINIKLVKCGGLRRAHEMIRIARRLGMQVMLGCKTESALGITAIAQLAGLADYLDLDGHLDLLDDPYMGIIVDRGWVRLPTGVGLGVLPRQSVLSMEQYSV